MSNEPERIRLDQVRDALQAMGIDRDTKDLESVSIEVDRVVVTRRRTDEKGRFLVIPWGSTLATVTTEIPLVGDL